MKNVIPKQAIEGQGRLSDGPMQGSVFASHVCRAGRMRKHLVLSRLLQRDRMRIKQGSFSWRSVMLLEMSLPGLSSSR